MSLPSTSFTVAETEIIFLYAAQELTTNMANLDMFDQPAVSRPVNIVFRDSARSKLFFIWLIDFVSKSDPLAAGESTTYLNALERIGQNPNFDVDGSVGHLRAIVPEFKNWLEAEMVLSSVWLPTLEIETDLKLTRLHAIRFSGNVLKHNVTRLARNTKAVVDALAAAGHQVSVQDALRATEDFQTALYDDVLAYHASTLVWYINEIRWAIHHYLEAEYKRSRVLHTDGCRYHFTYPSSISNPFAKEYYWALMNGVRSGPIVKRFAVTEWLQKRH